MKLQERTYREMTINSSQLIIPRETYQRELNPERVRKIVKEFDERVANEPKVSCRNGKYYVFDGQHTIAARKILNRGHDLPITCKVYYGMTESEEATLFAIHTSWMMTVKPMQSFSKTHSTAVRSQQPKRKKLSQRNRQQKLQYRPVWILNF